MAASKEGWCDIKTIEKSRIKWKCDDELFQSNKTIKHETENPNELKRGIMI